tara:strand:- start:268 stop:648 length:381 start_codon:yes stop_codon:yes gene_type:complete
MELSSVRKGRIGELKVIIDLLKKNYDVYTPVIDDKGIDLLVSNGDIVRKVQVKSHDNNKYKSSVEINTRFCKKSDVIAVPLLIKNCICYIPSNTVKRSINISFKDTNINNGKPKHWYKKYLDFPWK